MSLEESDIEDRLRYEDPEEVNGIAVENERVYDNAGGNEIETLEMIDGVPDRMSEITHVLRANETQTQRLLKAHISILVSALGGPDHTSLISPPPYKLGHDAYACLRDIKRWLKSVDERNNSFDVAIACAESGLLTNDLVNILCQWDSQMSSKLPINNPHTTEKIMLACLELLLLLTWPIDLNSQLSENQKLLYSDIQRYQVAYKSVILLFNKGQTLRAVIRLALPAIAKNKLDRDPRDNAITRLVMYLIRNILYIEPPSASILAKSRKQMGLSNSMPIGVLPEDVSIITVLKTYKENNVLMLLLTISGSIGVEFDRDIFGPVCLECLFLMTRGIRVSDLFTPRKPDQAKEGEIAASNVPLESITTTAGMHLSDLLSNEAKRKKVHSQLLPTRHSRFGSLLSIRSNDAPSYVVSGQEALHDAQSSFLMLDKSKKCETRTGFKYDSDEFCSSSKEVYINHAGRILLREFVENLLQGGCFNNLIESVGSIFAGSGDVTFIGEYEKACFFLTIAWFLEYKRAKATRSGSGMAQRQSSDEPDGNDFGSVGAALSEVQFILIISYFRESFSERRWSSLHVAMLCFRELMYISHSLFGKLLASEDDIESQEYTDRQLAEGIIRKLFSFNDFLNIIVLIPRTASKHSPDYLSVAVSVVQIVMKCFDSFANEDLKVYVRTERLRSKRKQPRVSDLDKDTENQFREIINDSDEEENEERLKLIKQERKLDLQKVESRFFVTPTVTTHIDYLSRYEDLSHEEIKRCLFYFQRLFVVNKDYTSLYRLDFMLVIHQLRDFLPRASSIRKHVEDLITYFMKKFKVAFERYPMPIEILFPRLEQTECKTFLGTGDLFQAPQKRERTSLAKVAKDLEFIKDDISLDEKMKILVSVLWAQERHDLLEWLQNDLRRIKDSRISNADGAENEFLRPKPGFARLMITNEYFRHLLILVGASLPSTLEGQCYIPPSVDIENLARCIEYIRKWTEQQPVAFEDGKPATFFLRPLESANLSSGYLGSHMDSAESDKYENGRSRPEGERNFFTDLDKLDELERKLDNSSRQSNLEELEKGHARTRRVPRAKKTTSGNPGQRPQEFPNITASEPQSQSRIVSAAWIHDSDDESNDEKDREFFEREEKLREMLPDTGLVTPEQLNEFKKAWSRLRSKNSAVSKNVHKALEQSSLFAIQKGEEVLQPRPEKTKLPAAKTASGNEFLDGQHEEDEASRDDKEEGSSRSRPVKKRRRMVLSDEE